MARTTAGDVLLQSMASLPTRGRPAQDVQAVLDAAAANLTIALPVCTMLTVLSDGAAAWYADPPASLSFPQDHALHIGLVDHWMATDHWPDFLHEVAPIYDLKAEAPRLASA